MRMAPAPMMIMGDGDGHNDLLDHHPNKNGELTMRSHQFHDPLSNFGDQFSPQNCMFPCLLKVDPSTPGLKAEGAEVHPGTTKRPLHEPPHILQNHGIRYDCPKLRHVTSSVHIDTNTVHVTGVVGGEKCNHRGYFFRLSKSPQWNVR